MITQATLDKIKSAVFPSTPEGKILAEAQKVIGDITDGFTKPGNISTHKIDLTDKVKEAGLTVRKFGETYGSIELSEADAVNYIAGQCTTSATPDKAKRIRLAKARSRAAKAKLALLSF